MWNREINTGPIEGDAVVGRVVVANWVSLDGVMQSPGRADEDTRGGFSQGGWATPYSDQVVGAKLGELMAGDYAWLFGRIAYEQLLESWNRQGGPFKDALNDQPKYVASSDPTTTLAWPRSTLLHGDVPAEVARLKDASPTTLVIMGSQVLINSLVRADLVDQLVLTVAPIVLGEGRRLFDEGTRTTLRLRESTPTTTGAVVNSYELSR